MPVRVAEHIPHARIIVSVRVADRFPTRRDWKIHAASSLPRRHVLYRCIYVCVEHIMKPARLLIHNDTPFNCQIWCESDHGMRFPSAPEEVRLTSEPPEWTWISWLVEWIRLLRFGPRIAMAAFDCPVEVDVYVDVVCDSSEPVTVRMQFVDDDLVWQDSQEAIWNVVLHPGQDTNVWIKSKTLGAFDKHGRKTQMVHGRPMKPDTVRFTVTGECEDNESWKVVQRPVTNAKYNRNWNAAKYCI